MHREAILFLPPDQLGKPTFAEFRVTTIYTCSLKIYNKNKDNKQRQSDQYFHNGG